jgi:hypothetical protein
MQKVEISYSLWNKELRAARRLFLSFFFNVLEQNCLHSFFFQLHNHTGFFYVLLVIVFVCLLVFVLTFEIYFLYLRHFIISPQCTEKHFFFSVNY